MSPADFAAAALHADVRSITAVERIKHGLTNESWLVRLGADAVVVRLGNADIHLQIHRDSEAAILETVSAAGIGPPVVLCDPQRHVLVTRYLGTPWSETDAQDMSNIARLGATLRQLHSLRPPAGVHRVELHRVVADYLHTLAQAGRQQDVQLSERGRRIAAMLDGRAHACLCHNDVHRLNVVDAGRIRLIDWEYAGVGAPLFDLASVCVYHGYDSAQRTQLLSAYASQEVASPELLELACQLFAYIGELWTKVRKLNDGRQSRQEGSRE